MNKILVFSMLFFALSNCGYEPIYSSKNLNLSINRIEADKTVINNTIINALEKIYSNENSENYISLKINSSKKINIKQKDSSGNPKIFELVLNVTLEIQNEENNFSTKKFSKSINFNNNDDKFKLSQYQNELENTLIKLIIEDVIIYLSNYQ